MLDHVFSDAIGALRDVLEAARLERQVIEERFQTDVLLGDLSWETSYGLPGEGQPPRVRCDITLEWPTWSQASYRSWYLDEEMPAEPPQILIEIVMRVQRLGTQPDPAVVMRALPVESPMIGSESLRHAGPSVETIYDATLSDQTWAIEVSYEGAYELGEDVLADGSALDAPVQALGGWISATLVRLGDLPFDFQPAEDPAPGSH